MIPLRHAILLLPLLLTGHPLTARTTSGNNQAANPEAADTVIVVDKVQVTAIKQGLVLRSEPVAATILGSRTIERDRVGALKNLSQRIPNFHAPDYGSRMTSSIYVRGLGARIDQAVIGLNVDNVPLLNKNNFDTELVDVERIEVLRGPQSTLYGRNTMGGVVNVYTLSPFNYQGVRLTGEYGSGGSYRFRASVYDRLSQQLALAATGYYTQTGGFFENSFTGKMCDWERLGGGRLRLQWRPNSQWSIDETFNFSILSQGGYPYAYIGETILVDGQTVLPSGAIGYNDPSSYDRQTISNGLTVRYDAGDWSISSITSYQYSDDDMILDQDFTPLDYFTLRQSLTEHAVTEDLVVRSEDGRAYRWLFGAFGFYRHGRMDAPVKFKRTGIEELILKNANGNPDLFYAMDAEELLLSSAFRMPDYGGALYHESRYVTGRWRFTAGIRADFERTELRYRSLADMDYTLSINGGSPIPMTVHIDEENRIGHTYVEVLPKVAAMYSFDEIRNLYVSVARGYKAGGFNTQMFSDILQEKLKWKMISGLDYQEPDIMSYRPEYSWNFELGGHFSCKDGVVRGDFALFYIDCRDQQLTVFPEGQSTGRMMTNAGQTRSLGAEVSVQYTPWREVDLNVAYGFTDARFVRYDNGQEDFAGKHIPYAPQHTLAADAVWTIPTGVDWLGDVVLQAGTRCAGRIWWNEQNTRSQPFYALLDATLRIEHPRYSIDFWGRNLTGSRYDVFYFKSMGNEFVQRGRPRTLGITLNINIQKQQP